MNCIVATASCIAALIEAGKLYGVTGDRGTLITGLRDRLLSSTYEQLELIFENMGHIVAKHGKAELVRVLIQE